MDDLSAAHCIFLKKVATFFWKKTQIRVKKTQKTLVTKKTQKTFFTTLLDCMAFRFTETSYFLEAIRSYFNYELARFDWIGLLYKENQVCTLPLKSNIALSSVNHSTCQHLSLY